VRHRRRHLQGARQPTDLRRPAAAAAPRPGCRRHRHDAGHAVLHAQGARHGEGRVSHPQHARPARQRRPRPGAISHGRQCLQRGRGAALLRQCPLRHRAGAQRQPHQRACAEAGAVRHRPPPHQHRQRHRGADQHPRARDGEGRPRRAADARTGVPRRARSAPPHSWILCSGRSDCGLRAAGLPRSLWHPPAGDRRGRPARGQGGDRRQRERGPGRHGAQGGA
jgi:hypothetical protein